MPRTGRPRTAKYVEWECLHCGKKEEMPEWLAKARRYCSRKCFHDSGTSGRKAIDPTPKPCKNCGTIFLTGGGNRPSYHQVHCSRECAEQTSGNQPSPRALDDIERAWLAGLFDGEGSIIFVKKRPARNIRIDITNTHLPLLERVLEVVGTGRIFDRSKYRKNPKHSDVWHWQCTGRNARDILRQIRPHLIVKAEKADVALSDEIPVPQTNQRSAQT